MAVGGANRSADLLFVRSLLIGKDTLVLRALSQRYLVGGLLAQDVQIFDRKIELRYCEISSEVSDPTVAVIEAPRILHTFYRTLTFGIPSGVLKKARSRLIAHANGGGGGNF